MMISRIIKVLLFVFLSSLPCAAASRLIVDCRPGEFVLQAEKTRLADILEKIRQSCRIQILGLEAKEKEEITFSSRGESPEEVIKRLLRYIKEENYALEFSDVNLTKVSVVPKSLEKSSSSAPPNGKADENAFVSKVEVKSIIEGTQAQSLGLQPGDMIVEYDGVKIDNPQTLVNEVKQKTDRGGTVEMLVVRDRRPMPVSLNAGLIGVRIGSKQIPKSEADNY